MGTTRTTDGRPGLSRPFLALVAAQAAHSVEEYLGRLYEVFPPARLVSGLVSDDLRRGFVIATVALVAFGLLCLVGPVRGGWRSARAVAAFCAGLEPQRDRPPDLVPARVPVHPRRGDRPPPPTPVRSPRAAIGANVSA